MKNPGYHTHAIPKGEVGEISKIVEEALEAVDADAQGVAVMVLVELSDLLGAVEQYLLRHHPTITLDDLRSFSSITQRAFTSGRRPSSSPASDGDEA